MNRKEVDKLKRPIYNIKFKDGHKLHYDNATDKNIKIEEILLYIHDYLHDMCDKGDTIKITLLEDLDMRYAEARMVNTQKHLYKGRYHWIEEKKYLRRL